MLSVAARGAWSSTASLLLSLSLSLLLSLSLSLSSSVVDAHFLFVRVDEEEREVRVFFSEPVAMEGKAITYVSDRVNRLTLIGPEGRRSDVDLFEPDDEEGYLWGRLPDELDNTPYLVTGFLDYGSFGEGDGPKSDLQYTYSAQLSSTNPSDDFSHFLHSTVGTDTASPFAVDGVDPFAVGLKSFGPPYRAVVRGVGPSTLVRVCLYDGNGSNERLGCVEGVHNRTHHLTFDADDIGVLRPCGTYFAVANTTTPQRNAWSSTSVAWNGPCSPAASRRRRPVEQWYESFRFGGRGGSTAATTTSKTTPSATSLWTAASAVFVSGVATGALASHFATRRRRRRSRSTGGGGDHSKIVESPADDDATTAPYSDDVSVSTAELT